MVEIKFDNQFKPTTITSNVDMVQIKGGKGNSSIINLSLDEFSALIYNFSEVSKKICYSAEEAGNAFRKLSNAILADYSPDIDNTLEHTALQMLQHAKGVDLLGPETPSETENSNEKEPFNFLEGNVYNQKSSILEPTENEFITPLEDL